MMQVIYGYVGGYARRVVNMLYVKNTIHAVHFSNFFPLFSAVYSFEIVLTNCLWLWWTVA